MKTAKEFAKECSWFEPTEKELKIMKEFAREAIKADRENVAKHAKWKSVPPRLTNMDGIEVDSDSIINAPQITLL